MAKKKVIAKAFERRHTHTIIHFKENEELCTSKRK
jgi:hypothetical protein